MSEYDYFTNSCYANFCKEEGYKLQLENLSYIHRFASYRIHQSLVQKPLNIDAFWSIGEKKEEIKEVMTKERWQKIKAIHGVK